MTKNILLYALLHSICDAQKYFTDNVKLWRNLWRKKNNYNCHVLLIVKQIVTQTVMLIVTKILKQKDWLYLLRQAICEN